MKRPEVGFSIIELIVAMAVIMVLAGTLVGGIIAVRQSARLRSALHVLGQLQSAMHAYRAEDARKRYPPSNSVDSSLSTTPLPGYQLGILEILMERGLIDLAAAHLDDQGRLVDPWTQSFRYVQQRPELGDPAPPPASGPLTGPPQRDGSSFPDWNWDGTQLPPRERRWGRHWDPISCTEVAGPLPFPYVFSLGRKGSATDGTNWIYLPEHADFRRRSGP